MKAIIFDADNTLYKSPERESAYREKFLFLEKKTGIDASKLSEKWWKIVKDVLNDGINDARMRSREYSTKKLLVDLGIEEKEAEKLTNEALQIFWKNITERLQFEDGTKELIKNLKDKYILGVASNEYRKSLIKKLNKVFDDWREYFRFLISPDDTGELKPSERYYEIILKKLDGVKPKEIVFVGDSWERDLELAKKIGMKTVLLNEKKEGEPDYWIKNIKDIKKTLMLL